MPGACCDALARAMVFAPLWARFSDTVCCKEAVLLNSSDPRAERALDADIVDWLLGRITSSTLKLGREKPASFGGSVADGDLATLPATDVGS